MFAVEQIAESNTRDYLPILDGDIDAAGSVDHSNVLKLISKYLAEVMSCYSDGGFDVWKFDAILVECFGIVVNMKEKSQRFCTFKNA